MHISQSPHTSIEALYGFGAILYGQKRPDSSPLVVPNDTVDRQSAQDKPLNAPSQPPESL